ncbi:putative ribonuclease H-like domain-containing protein [Tanacetum coccineum]
MSEFYKETGIKKEFSVARTPQQNGVAKRRNRTLIKAARTMLADSKLPTTFWAEAVNTACYVQNRVLVVKPHNKTPYELFRGRTHALSFMRPFGCHVTILNTLDYLGKFDGKSNEGFFVGYSMNSKAFKVYNIRTRKVEENLHIKFLEDKPIIAGDGPKWLFYIDVLTKSMNYVPVVAGTNSNDLVGTEESIGAGHSSKEIRSSQDYILIDARKKDDEGVNKESGFDDQERPENSTQDVNTAGPSINTASTNVNTGSLNINIVSPTVTTALLEATHADFFGDETEVDISNITTTYPVPSTPNTRIHKDHSLDHVTGDVQSGVQTRRVTKTTNKQGFISAIYEGKTHEDLYACLFSCFLSQEEPKKVIQALKDPSWIEAMQEELLQNKKDEKGIVIRNKERLVAQGYTQDEGIDYDEVFAPIARIEAIRLFLANASFKDFVVYQMDVNSAFLYGKLEEEDYVCQPLGFEDPDFPNRVYKVEKVLHGLHQAPRAWYETFSTSLLDNGFQRGLKVTKKDDRIFISQDKYVDEILKNFGFSTMKTTSTPMETSKPLMKDENAEDVDVHLFRSMIGSLMYLTSLRPDIIFAVCACARFQVTPKVSHLHAVKRIFRYLKSQLKLGLWYSKDSPFDLEAYTTVTKLATAKVKTINGEVQIQALVDKKKVIITETSIRRDLQLADENGTECLPNATIFAELERMGSTMAFDIICLATNQRFNFSKYIFDNMVQNFKGGVKFVMYPSQPVQKSKSTKVNKVTPGMKRLFKIDRSAQVVSFEDEGLGAQEDASKQGRKIADIDADAEVTLVDETQGRNDEEMFDTGILDGEEVFAEQDVVEKEVSTAKVATTTTVDKLTLTRTLIEIKAAKPKVVTTAATTTTTAVTRPKARGVEVAQKLQAQLDAELEEEEKLARQREEDANIAKWDNVQAMMDADYELATRLQAEEQGELTIEEKSRLFMELMNKRKKHFLQELRL